MALFQKTYSSSLVMGYVFMSISFLIVFLLGIALAYYRNKAIISETQEIACPIKKFCPEGTTPPGYNFKADIYFPKKFSELIDGEVLTIPYYDSHNNPVKKTLLVTIDTTTSSVPVGEFRLWNKNDIGHSGFDSGEVTIYLKGLSTSYSGDIDMVLAQIFRQVFLHTSSPYSIRSYHGSEIFDRAFRLTVRSNISSGDSLSVTSDQTSSTTLTGTAEIDFVKGYGTNPEGFVDVYQNFEDLSRKNLAKAFQPQKDAPDANEKYSWCKDSSFLADTCVGKEYDEESGLWVDLDEWALAKGNVKMITKDGFVKGEVEGIPFCSYNLDLLGNYDGRTTAAVNGYQTNGFGETILKETYDNNGALPDGAKYQLGSNSASKGNVTPGNGYEQKLVFCGGKTPTSDNFGPGDYPYDAKFPNKDTRNADGLYNTLGFPDK